MIELESCPFCKVDNRLQIWQDGSEGSVWCAVCGAEGPVGKTITEIVDKWNRRRSVAGPGVTITKCKECSERTPVNSHGWGVYCDELGEVLSETDTDLKIPDRCPKRSGVWDGDEYYSKEEIDRIWRLYNQLGHVASSEEPQEPKRFDDKDQLWSAQAAQQALEFKKVMLEYRDNAENGIGEEKWWQVMGDMGYQAIEEIPPKQRNNVLEAMEERWRRGERKPDSLNQTLNVERR